METAKTRWRQTLGAACKRHGWVRVWVNSKALKENLGQWRAACLLKQQVDVYIRDRQQQGKASATINNELQLLRRHTGSVKTLEMVRESESCQ